MKSYLEGGGKGQRGKSPLSGLLLSPLLPCFFLKALVGAAALDRVSVS